MNPEDLRSKITFESRPVECGRVMLTAKLALWQSCIYDKIAFESYAHLDDAVEEIKERLREEMMRRIYEDRRGELYEALNELLSAGWRTKEQMLAAEKILQIAKRFQPRTSGKEGA